jgi:hypothetical protein
MSLESGGMPFGEWGNTALEAAALGKIVVTNSLNTDLYRAEYGDCALQIANTPEALKETLQRLISLSDGELTQLKLQSREWVENKHSMMPTGERMWDKVYRGLIN